jgi:hypothetical protein
MNKKGNAKVQPRNPVTHAKHRREVFWQITIPVIIGVILIVGVAILIILASIGNFMVSSKLADISIIWLIIPAMIISLIVALILAGLVYLVYMALIYLPGISFKIGGIFDIVRLKVRQFSDLAVKPVVGAKSSWAAVRALFGK